MNPRNVQYAFLFLLVQTAVAAQTDSITLDGHRVHPTRILARTREAVTEPARQAVLNQHGLKLSRPHGFVPRLQVFDEDDNRPARAANAADQAGRPARLRARLAALRASGLFEYVEPDYSLTTQAEPTDAAFTDGTLWGLKNTGQSGGLPGADIGATAAWNITTGSTNIIVVVIDTGIRYTHQDLAAQMWRNPGEIPGNGMDDDGDGYVDNVHGINAITDSGDPMDDVGHGTHVAGTIGAAANDGNPHVGVAWNVRLMACKFITAEDTGFTSDAIQCIQFAASKGAKIANASWGSYCYSYALADAIEAAHASGMLFICAAGNGFGDDNDGIPIYPASYGLENIISVTALNRFDSLADFGNYGRFRVHLGAPGVEIFSTYHRSDSDYHTLNGTSMAAPHVSGVAALALAAYPGAGVSELRQRLFQGVVPITSLQNITLTGGRINAYNSIVAGPDNILEVEVEPRPGSLLSAGRVATFTVRLSNLHGVTNGSVVATVPGVTNLVFQNDGVAPDLAPNDHIYSASLAVPTNVTSLTMDAVAAGPGTTTVTSVWTFPVAVPPTNDNFANRTVLGGVTNQFSSDNFGATRERDEPCGGAGFSVWWSWTASSNGALFVSVESRDFVPNLSVLIGESLSSLELVAFSTAFGTNLPARVRLNVEAGRTYHVQVDSYLGNQYPGSFQLSFGYTPPPSNDHFDNSIALTGLAPSGSSYIYGATREVGEPIHAGVTNGHSVWWKWTAPSRGTVVAGAGGDGMSVEGAVFDKLLGVYMGQSVSNLTVVPINRTGLFGESAGGFDVAAGTTYHFAVDTRSQVGNVTFSLMLTPPPLNDDFAQSLALTGSVARVLGSNIGASKEPGESDHLGLYTSHTVWWHWTAPTSGPVSISLGGGSIALDGLNFGKYLAVFTGDSLTNLTTITGAALSTVNNVTFDAVEGQTYRIVGDGYAGRVGDLQLILSQSGSSRFESITRLPDGGVRLNFSGGSLPNTGILSYSILYSTNLVDWLPIATAQSFDGYFQWTDTTAVNEGARFYRAVPVD